ncbi:MAG: c-type cytochrome [Deltaproteobacteria bacterium]|nr:c-type cytochrome [Deltaproteobacteria bacterium]
MSAASALLTCGGDADEEQPVERGARLYAETCSLCHGERGEGYRADDAPRLTSPEFLSRASDEFLRVAILQGRPGTTMSAWATERGGPLSADDANAIVSFLRSIDGVPPVPLDPGGLAGDPARARPIYEAECRSCHGEKGEGGRYINLGNPVFLSSVTDAFLRDAISIGRAATPMAAFDGKIPSSSIVDLVALLRSWQRPIDGPETLPPRPGQLTNVVLNPGGPEPDLGSRPFVPADTVKAAMDRGATFVLADARPPSDYSGGHIAGAISVPFYEVAPYLPQIPPERAVVVYCACPHAESGVAADAMRARGYARVMVLDEGFKVWRARNYPVRSGGKP